MSDEMHFLPPECEEAYRSARLRWQLALGSPVIYLLVGQWARSRGWFVDADGVHRFDGTVWQATLGLLTGILVGAIPAMRWWQTRRLARLSGEPETALRRWMIDFYILAGMADTLAFLGLCDYAVAGRMPSLLIGGVLSYLGYALACPRRRDLARLLKP